LTRLRVRHQDVATSSHCVESTERERRPSHDVRHPDVPWPAERDAVADAAAQWCADPVALAALGGRLSRSAERVRERARTIPAARDWRVAWPAIVHRTAAARRSPGPGTRLLPVRLRPATVRLRPAAADPPRRDPWTVRAAWHELAPHPVTVRSVTVRSPAARRPPAVRLAWTPAAGRRRLRSARRPRQPSAVPGGTAGGVRRVASDSAASSTGRAASAVRPVASHSDPTERTHGREEAHGRGKH